MENENVVTAIINMKDTILYSGGKKLEIAIEAAQNCPSYTSTVVNSKHHYILL